MKTAAKNTKKFRNTVSVFIAMMLIWTFCPWECSSQEKNEFTGKIYNGGMIKEVTCYGLHPDNPLRQKDVKTGTAIVNGEITVFAENKFKDPVRKESEIQPDRSFESITAQLAPSYRFNYEHWLRYAQAHKKQKKRYKIKG